MRHGFLLVDKPKGPTSHDVVTQVRNVLHEREIGHLGTLDPLATGLLVLAVGSKALKVIELLQESEKEYVANIHFGATSSTYDAEGPIEATPRKEGWEPPDEVTLRRIIDERFQGTIEQTPPRYSAVHAGDGLRAYQRARQGRDVQLQPRRIEIQRCTILAYAYPNLTLSITCSAGTYIRSLAHDLGQFLRCGGYLQDLRRTRVGLPTARLNDAVGQGTRGAKGMEWSIDQSVPPDNVQWTDVLPLKDILKGFPGIELTAEEAEALRHGRNIHREVKPRSIGWFEGLPIVLLEPARDSFQTAHPRKVL